MTSDGMEKSIPELRDNQVVQEYRLGRTEANLDRLESVVEKLAHGFIELQSAMRSMVQTVEGLSATVESLGVTVAGLSATVDRFIRGMEHNGHRPPDEGPEGVS
jgi:TolA-binding protein